MSASRGAFCNQIRKLVALYQEHNRFFPHLGMLGRSLIEMHVLFEVRGEECLRPSDLKHRLMIDGVSLSRAISSLKKQKFLIERSDFVDSRSKNIFLGPAAYKLLEWGDEQSHHFLDSRVAKCGVDVVEKLKRYFSRLADGLSVPPSASSPKENYFRVSVRRITRGFGLLSSSAFGGEGISSVEWIILSNAADADRFISAATLRKRYSIRSNTISGIIERLCGKGYLEHVPGGSTDDKRLRPLVITAAGRDIVRRVNEAAVQKIKVGTADFSVEDLSDFVRVFRLFLGIKDNYSEICSVG